MLIGAPEFGGQVFDYSSDQANSPAIAFPATPCGVDCHYSEAVAWDNGVIMCGVGGTNTECRHLRWGDTQWTVLPTNLPRAFSYASMVEATGKLWVMGGFGGDTYLFDGNSWTPGPNLPLNSIELSVGEDHQLLATSQDEVHSTI